MNPLWLLEVGVSSFYLGWVAHYLFALLLYKDRRFGAARPSSETDDKRPRKS